VEELADADPSAARAGAARRRLLPMASPKSVFGADVPQHQLARTRIRAAFSAEAMAGPRGAMAEVAADHVARWPRGRPFRLLPRIRTLVDEIFVRLMLGVNNDQRARAMVKAIRRMLWTPGNPPVTLPGQGESSLDRAAMLVFDRRKAPLVRLLAAEIDERRSADPGGDDVLACMLRGASELTSEAIIDELLAILMAGQEPPAIALTSLLDRLGRAPGLADRFGAPGEEALTDALVRETLRLRPPAAGMLRLLAAPLRIGDQELPAGASVMVPIALVHRNPHWYRDPDRFLPERWRSRPPPASVYLPFGDGVRRCLGEALAHAEIKHAIPAIVERVRVRPLSRRPERLVRGGRSWFLNVAH
jgi:cytochrome P450 family 135